MGFMTRSRQREHVFKLIFQVESVSEQDIRQHFKNYLNECKGISEVEREAIEGRASKILPFIPEIDKLLNDKTIGWKTSRMNKVDLAILRLAVYEILYDEDIPEGVAINEGVELAKKYSGQDGPAFVNGVLAKFTEDKMNG